MAEGQPLPHKYAIAATRHQDAIDAGLDREIQQMADVADQLVTTLEKTVEELRRRAGVPPYDPANAYTLGAPPPLARPPEAIDQDALAAEAMRLRPASLFWLSTSSPLDGSGLRRSAALMT